MFYAPAADLAKISTASPNHDIELQNASVYDSMELKDEDSNVNLNSYSLDNFVNFFETDKECNRKIFVHVVKNILGCSEDSHLFQALEENGIATIGQLMAAPDHVITSLSFTNKTRKFVSISLFNKECLQLLREYVRDKNALGFKNSIKDYSESDFYNYQEKKYSSKCSPIAFLENVENDDDNPDPSFCDSTMGHDKTSSALSIGSSQVYGTPESPPYYDVCKMLLTVDSSLCQVSPPDPQFLVTRSSLSLLLGRILLLMLIS